MVLPKLSECSVAELEEMAKAINVEMVKREDERFKTLCRSAADAFNALKREFPWVSYEADVRCDCCGEGYEVNLFDLIGTLEVSHFRR